MKLQQGSIHPLKKDKKAASFMTIGEPDVRWITPSPHRGEGWGEVEIAGMDIYDPIKDTK